MYPFARCFAAVAWIALCPASRAQSFVHPGCLSTRADLDRMAAKVAANEQPWKSGFDRLASAPFGQLGHTPNPQATVYVSGSQPDNYLALARDAAAAYQVALRYQVTGDERYADKAVAILMAWANTHTSWDGNTNVSLRAGLYGYQLACAGELVRDHDGWAAEDFAAFQGYVRTQFYKIVSPNDVDRGFLFHRHGTCWSHYWANWELAAMATVIATGVLCDDRAIFDEAIDYFHNGTGVGRISELLHYRHPNGLGQSQEFGRDQGHASMLVPLLGTFCEIAWNQGIDLYGELDHAFLAMSETLARYNLGQDVPYVTYVNCDNLVLTNIGGTGRGSNRAGLDLVYHHYVNRMGLSAPYTREAAESIRPEGGGGHYGGNSGGYDQLGFTTLTHSLDPIAAGAAPGSLRPHVEGTRITLSWRGSAYAESYTVKRSDNAAGPYETVATVAANHTYFIDAGRPPGSACHYVVASSTPGGTAVDSAVASATADGLLRGTIIGTEGSWGDRGARKEGLFDGSLKNFFDAPVAVAWAGLDLGEGASAVITEVRYCPRAGFGGRMTGGKFQGSSTADFSSGVVDLFTIGSAPPDGVLTSQGIGNGTAFRYVRYLGPSNGFGNAAELQFHGTASGVNPPATAPTGLVVVPSGDDAFDLSWDAVPGATDYIVKRATSGGGPFVIVAAVSGSSYRDHGVPPGVQRYTVSALNDAGETAGSAEAIVQVLMNVVPGSAVTASADNAAWNPAEAAASAIDQNAATKWYTGGNTGSAGWLQVDLGEGSRQAVVRYDLTSANDVPQRDPLDWVLEGSDDGIGWMTLDARTGETFGSRFLTRSFDVVNEVPYRHYRLNIAANAGGGTTYGIQLAEIGLFAVPRSAPEVWRFDHFGTFEATGNAADSADPDGDGWSNAGEFAAGTDPNSAAALLKIDRLAFAGNDVVIAFPTVAGRRYRVERSAILLEGSWQIVADPVAGTGGEVEVHDEDAAADPRRFYRIVVLP